MTDEKELYQLMLDVRRLGYGVAFMTKGGHIDRVLLMGKGCGNQWMTPLCAAERMRDLLHLAALAKSG